MVQPAKWASFYKTLNRLGPRLLQGVDPALQEFIAYEAKESDAFWSDSLEAEFETWSEDPQRAVRYGLRAWVDNVQRYLLDILGPDSLFPFDYVGVSSGERRRLIASVEKIKLRLDKEHLHLFIDSVLLDSANTPEAATLLVQAVIAPQGTTDEGVLVRAVTLPWHMIVHQLKTNWALAYQIPPQKWEELVAAAFDQAGFDEVILTPRSGDHGRDVIAIKGGVGSIRIIDSVKAYKPGHLVRYDDVRSLAGVLLGDPKASKGIVTTTSSFAPGITKDPFLAPLMPFRLELMDCVALQQWLEDLSMS